MLLLSNKTCCFCHKLETIRHLFFYCRFARSIWNIIFLFYGITRPTDVENMFQDWLGGFDRNLRNLVFLRAVTTIWSIWLTRNGIVFEKKINSSPLQVISTIIHWLRTWTVLQKAELQPTLMEATHCLARVAMDFFFRAH